MFKKVDSLSEEELVYKKKITKVQQGIEGISFYKANPGNKLSGDMDFLLTSFSSFLSQTWGPCLTVRGAWMCHFTARRSAGWRLNLKSSRKWYWDKSRYKCKSQIQKSQRLISFFTRKQKNICKPPVSDLTFDFWPLQALGNASQTQSTVKATSNQLTREVQTHLVSIKLLNQSLERFQDQVDGWKEVIEETDEKMKTLTKDQYDIKATAEQVNTTVALRWMKDKFHTTQILLWQKCDTTSVYACLSAFSAKRGSTPCREKRTRRVWSSRGWPATGRTTAGFWVPSSLTPAARRKQSAFFKTASRWISREFPCGRRWSLTSRSR